MTHIRFHDTISPISRILRQRGIHWPLPHLEALESLPTIAVSHTDDLKLELEQPCRLRYWVSRLTLQDRPQTESGHYEGGYPRITVEANVDGVWYLVDGYQGHTV